MEKKIVKKKAAAPKAKAVAKKPAASCKAYTFALHAPHAKKVEVVGDFNSWEIGKNLLTKGAGGIWKKAVSVNPGTYHYKYLVDGEWWLDPEKETAPNSYGTENNVLKL